MSTQPKIYVAGHRGMVGSAIVRYLLAHSHKADHIITRTHVELDLVDQSAVRDFFAKEIRNFVIEQSKERVGHALIVRTYFRTKIRDKQFRLVMLRAVK